MKTPKVLQSVVVLGAFALGLGVQTLIGEPHPMLAKARAALNNAKMSLEKADRDFAGHRTKAVEHINMALEEIRLAAAADK